MSFLIRIILQRTLAIALALLTFLGIEVNFSNQSPTFLTREQRQEIVTNILSDQNNKTVDSSTEDTTKIFEIQKEKNQNEKNKKTEYVPVKNTEQKNNQIKKETPPPTPTEPKNSEIPTIQENPIDFVSKTLEKASQPNSEEISKKGLFEIKDVLVNIICNQKDNNIITVNTGSGVIISPNGVVITNAHIGQYFLLNKGLKYHCSLYKENIPTYGYTADLLFISPDWIKENPNVIKNKNPRGSGENDYAFLYITGNTNPTLKNPTSFPYAKFNSAYNAEIGDKISIAGYPGSPDSLSNITKSVSLKIDTENYIKDIFTFGNNLIDVISTQNSPVAARGSSGGGIFKIDKLDLIGLIVTIGNSSKDNTYINAITTNYIDRDLKKDFNLSVQDLISGNLSEKVSDFWQNYGQNLAQIILKNLN